MKNRIPVGRIIASIVAVILLVLSAGLLSEASKGCRRFRELSKTEPLNMEVDLSKAGRYSGLYRKTYYSPHGTWLHLKSDAVRLKEKVGAGELEGVQGKVSVVDSNGQVLMTQDFTNDDFHEGYLAEEEEPCPTLWLDDFASKKGDFRLAIDVVKPATGLKNTHQILKARYVMCGLEVLPAAIMRLTGIVAGGISITIVAVVIVRTAKGRKNAPIRQISNATE